MIVLQIEHKVPSYENWKKVFDSDPIDRKGSGVTHYLIFRSADDPDYVTIHLGFNTLDEAYNTLNSLQKFWHNAAGAVMFKPQSRIMTVVEAEELVEEAK